MFKNSNPVIFSPTYELKSTNPKSCFCCSLGFYAVRHCNGSQCRGLLYQGNFQRAQGEPGPQLTKQGLTVF